MAGFLVDNVASPFGQCFHGLVRLLLDVPGNTRNRASSFLDHGLAGLICLTCCAGNRRGNIWRHPLSGIMAHIRSSVRG